MSDPRSRTADAALTVGAVLGLLCIVASVAAVVFGITPLVFRSGSMAPAIPTGSLAVGRDVPAQELRSGDVVSVERPDGSRITHRVEAVDSVVGNSATLQLKGDANDSVDAEPYTVTSAVRVLGHVPYLGYFVAWLSTPFAWASGALLSAALIRVAFVPRAKTPEQGPRHARHSTSSRSAVTSIAVVTVVASAVGVGASRADLTEAAITDTAYGRASLTAGALPGPTSFTCTTRSTGVLTSTVDLSFPNVNPLYTYVLTFSGGLLGGSPTPIIVNPTTTTPIIRTPASNLITLGTTTVTLVARLNGFVSSPALTRQYTSLTGLSASCSPAGTTTSSVGARSARVAAPTEDETTTLDPTTQVTVEGSADSSASTTTSSTTVGTEAPVTTTPTSTTSPQSTTTPPVTTTAAPPPPTSTT
ncbi:S24/S26 family peptidase, partial [Rhodococcus sp. BP-331]